MSDPVNAPTAQRIARLARRGRNAGVRWRNGLRIRAESISPLEANDLYVAHLSIYHFGSQFAADRRVLDLGCGTGYGSDHLMEAGASEVIGVDLDAKAIRFARRRFARPDLEFRVADAQELPDDLGQFGFVLSSNVFEHLPRADDAIGRVAAMLEADGRFLLVVPPITDEESLAVNERNPYHVSNFFVDEWRTRLQTHFAEVQAYQHVSESPQRLDFASPFRSTLTPEDFAFRPVTPEELSSRPTIGAVFLCRLGES